MRQRIRMWIGSLLVLHAVQAPGSDPQAHNVAIVDVTLIDGRGGAPLPGTTIVVEGKRIAAIGPRTAVVVPPGATILDGKGKYVVPGLIDVNVHVTGVGFMEDLFALSLYDGNHDPLYQHGYALEAAQMALKAGVTTIRDSYGPLLPLLALRDAIARGEVVGPRLQVAGDIIGWGGPYHYGGGGLGWTPPTSIEEHFNDYFHAYAPVGIELTVMEPAAVRSAINAYLDKGPDFIKIGVTSHSYSPPVSLTFSPRILRVIVEEAHRRGLKVDVHSSSLEGHLVAAEAGVDVITHAGGNAQELSDELIRILRERQVICVIFANMTEGPVAALHERQPDRTAGDAVADAVRAMWPYRAAPEDWPKSSAARLREGPHSQAAFTARRRRNQKRLIEGGCTIAVGTDNAPMQWPQYYQSRPQPYFADPGVGTIIAIEGLVKLGMTPGGAIVAATKNGALATGRPDELGTVEVGKLADLLLLTADPLADISNLRKLDLVMKEGQLIEPDSLPTHPNYYRRGR